MKDDDDADDDYSFVVKNLDTGETLDLDEAEVKFSVMGLQSRLHDNAG